MLTKAMLWVGRVVSATGTPFMVPALVAVAGVIGTVFFGFQVFFGGPSSTEIAHAKRAATAEAIVACERASAETAANLMRRAREAENAAGAARVAAENLEQDKSELWREIGSLARPSGGTVCFPQEVVSKINSGAK